MCYGLYDELSEEDNTEQKTKEPAAREQADRPEDKPKIPPEPALHGRDVSPADERYVVWRLGRNPEEATLPRV